MRHRKAIPILVALLFCFLTVALISHTRITRAQEEFPPVIGVDLLEYVVQPGEYLYAGFALWYFPCIDQNNDNKCNYQDKYTSIRYRFDVQTRGSGATNVDSCEHQGLNQDRIFAPSSYNFRRSLGPIPLRISRNCQPGPYTLLLTVTYTEPDTNQSQTLTDNVDFVVGEPSPPTPTPGSGGNGGNGGNDGSGGNGGTNDGNGGNGGTNGGSGGNGGTNGGSGGNGGTNDGNGGNGGTNGGSGGNGGTNDGNGGNGGTNDGNGGNGGTNDGNGGNGGTNDGNGGNDGTNDGNGGNGGNGGTNGGNGGNGGTNGGNGQSSRDTQTPKSEPSPKPPEPTQEPPPSQGPIAITQPDRTNVRLGPGTVYKIVKSVPHGTQAQIICIGPWADWYEVKIDGVYGTVWISRDLTVLVGSLDGICRYRAGAFTVTALTWPVISHLRVGPGTNYDVITTVPAGTSVKIIGLGPEDKWFLIELAGLEEPAWIHQSLVELTGSVRGYRQLSARQITRLPRPGPTPWIKPYLITLPDNMNLRLGPDLGYDVITTVPQGTQATIHGMDPDRRWFQVELEGLESMAWVHGELTQVVGSLLNVRRVTHREIAALPAVVIQPRNFLARLGPSEDFEAITILPKGTWARVIGFGPHRRWLQIKVVGLKTPHWVARNRVKVAGGLLGTFRPHAVTETVLQPGSEPQSLRPLAFAQSESMKVRTGPGLDYRVITTVPQGVSGKVYGIDPTKNWLQVEIEGLDTLAWVLRDMTWIDGLLVSVRRITAREIDALPALITQPRILRARSGPGPDYRAVARLPKGTWVKIVGIGPHAEWLQIEAAVLDAPVWIARNQIKIAGGSLALIPRTAPEDDPPASSAESSRE